MSIKGWNAQARAEYLRAIENGQGRKTAARCLQLDPDAIDAYAAAHPDFAADVEEAERTQVERVEQALYDEAIGGNVAAQKLLRKLHAERAKPRQNE